MEATVAERAANLRRRAFLFRLKAEEELEAAAQSCARLLTDALKLEKAADELESGAAGTEGK